MAEVQYGKEKCWGIQEKYPIEVTKEKNRYGEWDLIFPVMGVRYETFNHISMYVTHLEAYGHSYDYREGIATLSVTSKGLEDILEMGDLVLIKN